MTDYKGVLAALKAQRAVLERERLKLDRAILAIEDLIQGWSTIPQDGQSIQMESDLQDVAISRRAFSGLTMPQAIEKYLRLAGEPKTKKQIQEALKTGGMHASKSFSAHLYNTLHRLSKSGGHFRREADGRWGLLD